MSAPLVPNQDLSLGLIIWLLISNNASSLNGIASLVNFSGIYMHVRLETNENAQFWLIAFGAQLEFIFSMTDWLKNWMTGRLMDWLTDKKIQFVPLTTSLCSDFLLSPFLCLKKRGRGNDPNGMWELFLDVYVSAHTRKITVSVRSSPYEYGVP